MSDTQKSPSELLVEKAWKALWDKNKPDYYLPNLIINGLEKDGKVDVAAIKSLPIPDINGFNMGKVGTNTAYISLMELEVTGLDSLADGGMTYNDSTKGVTAKINFGALVFSGSYQISVGGATGCALNTAKFFGGGSLSANMAASDLDTDQTDDERAYQMRDALLESDSGALLVGKYYQNNEAFNTMFSKSTELQNTWANWKTGGKTTSYYMDHTRTALNPDNIDSMSVNRTPIDVEGQPSFYDQHAFYMATYIQTIAARVASAYRASGDEATADQFDRTVDDTASFHTTTMQVSSQNANGMTGKSVLNTISSSNIASPPRPDDDTAFTAYASDGHSHYVDFLTEIEERARAHAQNVDVSEIVSSDPFAPASASDATLNASPSDSTLNGTFTTTLEPSTLNVTGTLTFSVDPLAATTDIKSLGIDNLQISVEIKPSGADGWILGLIESNFGKNGTAASMLKSQIESQLQSNQVLTFLTTSLNNALAQKFGSLG